MNRGEPATRRADRAFTLIELLIVIAIIAILASLLIPSLVKAKQKTQGMVCLGNLKQWGLAMHLYVSENDDYLPPEGTGTSLNSETGWYIALPRAMNQKTYNEMPWRTNAAAPVGHSIWICPANTNRSNGNNLFHYCLNEHIDGTGPADGPAKLSTIPQPAQVVFLFDNGKKAARAQQNNVHTNLHSRGANFSFLDGHAARFRNTEYWDFKSEKGLTNNPSLIWTPAK